MGGKGILETALERSVRIVYNRDTFGVCRGDQVPDGWTEGAEQAVMGISWDCNGEPCTRRDTRDCLRGQSRHSCNSN